MLNNDNEVFNFNLQEHNDNWLALKLAKGTDLSKLLPDYTAGQLQQVLFLIHQINYWTNQNTLAGGLSISTETLGNFFGCGGKVSTYLKDLQKLNIINKKKNYSIEGNSNTYNIIKPYGIKDDKDVDLYWFNIENKKCPVFIKKFLADGRKILSKANTIYTPESTTKSNSTEYIKQLENLLTANGIAIPTASEEDMNKIEKATKHLASLKKAPDSTKLKEVNALGLNNGLNMTEGHSKQTAPKPAPEVKAVVQPVVTAAPVSKTSGTFIPVEGSRGCAMLNNDAFTKEVSPLTLKETYELNKTVMVKFKQEFEGDFNIELRNEIVTFRCFHAEKSVEYIKCTIKNLVHI